jgi:L-lactate dehydrogenase complex protein LldG
MNGGVIITKRNGNTCMNASRENILQRIRKNLSDIGEQVTDVREHQAHGIPEEGEVLVNRFTRVLEKAGGRVIRCRKENLPAELAKIFSTARAVWIEPRPFLEGVRSESFPVGNDPARCDGAVTTCDALIAETGTVILSGGEYRKRVSSLIVATHCVVASSNQLMSTLDEYFIQCSKSDPSWSRTTSTLTLITGPSRTADIEKVLIQGMHGPRELVVVFIEG